MAKICIVCAYGGHLTEALYLLDAFREHQVFFITYRSEGSNNLPAKYLFDAPRMKLLHLAFKVASYLPALFKIIRRERPDVIVSTGGEIAIPVFYFAKFFGIRTIFVETWTRIQFPTITGKIVYHVTDVFLVQWPELLKKYGKRARYIGGIA